MKFINSVNEEECLDFNLSEEQLSLQLKARNFVENILGMQQVFCILIELIRFVHLELLKH